ncbi:IS630 family transposase [Streptomyces prunicolor]|uniref:IS630 family transposase n=1 Tax=Streptomyces prunicolor TaxID=67348 RepID=UPI0038706DB7|nr:IS630 family transposase [Streptomyces prunicolor]
MPIVLNASERHRLKKMAHGHVHVDTVRTWRGRFAAGGLPALADRKCSRRPARFTSVQVSEAKALACQLPAETGTPLSHWSCPELADELTARGITGTVSVSTVRRWLHQETLKPWQHRSWIFIRDPDFRAKAQQVLDLYARTFEGILLGPDEYVISSDEKTSIQARCRCHPTLAPGQARAMRVSHEYGRGGALAYLAAYDVHRATVFGRCEPKTGIVPFMSLVKQVMAQEPYASAKRVFWIVDNGSSHRGQRSIDRLAARFPNAVLVHTPVHASWLNQVEIFFSIVQRKVVSPNDFTDLTQVRDRLRAFEDRYSATAQPFQWRFTTTDLDELLARLDRHTLTDRQEESSVDLAACSTPEGLPGPTTEVRPGTRGPSRVRGQRRRHVRHTL